MTAPDPFAPWRARYGVATVATATTTAGNAAHPRESGDVAGVASVAAPDLKVCVEAANRAAAALLRAARDGAEALATPDPDLAREREEVAAAQAAEARGLYGEPLSPLEHRAVLAGYRAAALQRPPAWSDATRPPPPGAWCSCCGQIGRLGGRWWRAAEAPRSWRCRTCHPPDQLPAADVVEVTT